MAITIQERDLMHAGIQRPLSSLLATKKEYNWADKPTAAEFGKGQAWFSDIEAMGYSDGVNWSVPGDIKLLQKASGWIVPSLASANAATYAQSGTTITVTSTGHTLTATANGKNIFLAMGTAATGATIQAGWFSDFTYVDANTFTCISATSQTGTGAVNTNTSETVITELTTSVPAGLMGANGVAKMSIDATYTNSVNVKTLRAYFGGSIYLNYGPTTTSSVFIPEKTIKNRKSVALQHLGVNAQVAAGTAASAPIYSTVNTNNSVSMTFSAINSVANEFVIIEFASITVASKL